MKKPVNDVFGFWKIKECLFSGKYEIPIVHGTSKIPDELIQFSKCHKECDTKNKAVHFYELDEKFAATLESHTKLAKKLGTFRKYQSVILPDFSVYREMPLAMQIFQVYKSRAVGAFLNANHIPIVPNVRWGDERTYEFAFEGIEKHSVVSVGVLGIGSSKDNYSYFVKGFYKMLESLEPQTILCYGNLPEELRNECFFKKINFKEYQTAISKVFSKKEINAHTQNLLQKSLDFF